MVSFGECGHLVPRHFGSWARLVCRILAGGCGVSMVSKVRVRFRIKVRVRD